MTWSNVPLVISTAGMFIEFLFDAFMKTFFCFSNCVRSHIDVCFKEGKCRFICVEHSCPGEYSMRLVEDLLPAKDLKRLNRRIQEENIRQGSFFILRKLSLENSSLSLSLLAEIDGLECCPYCPYAVIVDNPEDKIFRCLNPECLKETCR